MTLNGHTARPSDLVRIGDRVQVDLPEPAPVEPQPEAIALTVVYEDDAFLVIDKPAGMVVHPAPGHHSGTLVHALLGRGGSWSAAGGETRPGIVHRLDRGTSGLIVVARTDEAHRVLADQLSRRTLSRTYLAIVVGRLPAPSGVLEGPIGRDPRDRKRMAVVGHGRFARTRYEVEEVRDGLSLVRCDLDTGRTHQIRVHLSAAGHPVAGDTEYGGGLVKGPSRPLLHAWRLRLRHPADGREMAFEAAPPADFESFWESLI